MATPEEIQKQLDAMTLPDTGVEQRRLRYFKDVVLFPLPTQRIS